jgi:anaerobic magnesium-protoporphyrin IX monomethyl ester cyclase
VHVALVNPPQVFSRLQVAAGITPPLGVAYLAGWLERACIDVSVVDALGADPSRVTPFRGDALLRGLDLDATVAAIPPDVDLVGISNLFTFAWPVVVELSRRIQARRPDLPIVVGGHHPSALPQECLGEAAIDYVVIGEGELPLEGLCRALAGEQDFGEVEGLALRRDGGVVVQPASRRTLPDVATLPRPARHLLPMQAYCTAQEAHGPVSGPWTTILSSRGCPYGCTFCASRKTRWRPRPAADVVDEMEECVARWGVREFHFEDDNMTIDRGRILAIAEEVRRRGLAIRWQTPNGIRASVTDGATLRAMRDSGCCHITLAPESGSPRVLKEIIRKGADFDLEQLFEVAVDARELGMRVAAYFVIGLPGETRDEVEQSIAYARRLARAGVDEVGFSLFTPLPGTPLWDVVARRGEPIDYLDLLSIDDLGSAVSFSDELSAAELNRLRRKGYLTFLASRARHHPRALARMLVNVARGRQETKTDRVLISLLRRTLDRSRFGRRRQDGV